MILVVLSLRNALEVAVLVWAVVVLVRMWRQGIVPGAVRPADDPTHADPVAR